MVIALGIGSWAYWRYMVTNPSRVFDNMLHTVLTSPSVTKKITQTQGEQKLDQTIQLTTEPAAQTHGLNILEQSSDTVVTTESVGQLDADYVRYNSIQTKQKNAEGKAFDFSKVIGLWGKVTTDKTTGSAPQLYNQSVLGVVPTAHLNPEQRKALIEQIKKDEVYKVDYDKAKRQKVNGRPVYTYPVTLDPVTYIKMLKTFSSQLGMHELDDVKVEDYSGTQPLKFTFTIDIISGQLTKIIYINETDPENPNRVEDYSAYGARVVVPAPQSTLQLDALQERLQQIR